MSRSRGSFLGIPALERYSPDVMIVFLWIDLSINWDFHNAKEALERALVEQPLESPHVDRT